MDVWLANLKCPTCGNTVRNIEPAPQVDFQPLTVYIKNEQPTLRPCCHKLPLDKMIIFTVDQRTQIIREIELV